MIARLTYLWSTQRKALIAFVGIVCFVAYFGIKTLTATIYWMDPAHQDQALQGWMTPRYVSMSYEIPPEVVGPALFLVRGEMPRRIRLADIATEQGMTMEELQARIDAATADFRASLND